MKHTMLKPPRLEQALDLAKEEVVVVGKAGEGVEVVVGAVKAEEEVEGGGVVKRVQLVNNKHEQLFRWHKGETVVAGGQRRHSGIHLLTDFSRRACFQYVKIDTFSLNSLIKCSSTPEPEVKISILEKISTV